MSFFFSAAADDIPSVHVMEESHNSTDSMKIKWEEPKNPNGLIVKYIIEYQRVDPNNVIIFIWIFSSWF